MSAASSARSAAHSGKMKKDESFLGKLGGTLARKKKAKEGKKNPNRYYKRDVTMQCCCPEELLSMVLFYIHFILSSEMGFVWHQSSLAVQSCSFREYPGIKRIWY